MDVRDRIAYGEACTIYFELYEVDATALLAAAPTFAAGDVTLVIDGAAAANATNTPAYEGGKVFSLALTAAEVTGAEIALVISDQTATQTWYDKAILLRTFGHPDAYDPDGVVAAGLLSAGGAAGGTLPAGFPTYDISGYVLEVIGGAGVGTITYIATYNTGSGAFTLEENALATLDTTSKVKVYPAAKGFPSAAVSAIQSGLATAAALATVDGIVDAILDDTNTSIPALIAALNNLSAAQVNAEVVDALATDTYAEPGQGTPAATASLATKLGYVYKRMRNRQTQTAAAFNLYNDDGVTVDQKATVSDDGTTYERGELTTGP